MAADTNNTRSNIKYWKYLIVVCLGLCFIQTCKSDKHKHASEQVQNSIEAYGEEWLGTPHRLGGTSKSGIDCSGLVQKFYQEAFKIHLPRSSQAMIDVGYRVERKALESGDRGKSSAQKRENN